MEIKQIQYFLAVAEAGSFSTAAEELYISQSSLSKQIIALEKELDIQLFDRSKRKISLTDGGRSFYKHALHLNKIYKALLSDLEEYKKIDPITQVLDVIKERNYATEAEIEAIDERVKDLVEECAAFAEESPFPEAQQLYDVVYDQENYPFIPHRL